MAHGLGNRPLVDLLDAMAKQPPAPPATDATPGQVVFAAPDVDTGIFKAKASSRHDPLGPLHAALEPGTARMTEDQCAPGSLMPASRPR